MSELNLDDELLEWALPVLQEFLKPSRIAVRLSVYLTQEKISEIRQKERIGTSAEANLVMVRGLQSAASANRTTWDGSQGTPIFTALLDILREGGYDPLERLLKNPTEIIDRKAHLHLFEVYLPMLTELNVNELMIHMIQCGLFSTGSPEHDLVMATSRNEGNDMAMLDVLNQVWRKKQNWSQLLIKALRNYQKEGGIADDLVDMIDTMERKIMAERKAVENEKAMANGSDPQDDLESLADSLRSFHSVVKGDADRDNMASPEFELQASSNSVNDLSSLTPVKFAETPAAFNLSDRMSVFSEERNSSYAVNDSSETGLTTSDTNSRSLEPLNHRRLVLRPYQKELAEPALEGKNVIIVAPTGSGKTVVAIKIALEHLEEGADLRDHKIAFFVPTVALVAQQERMFKEYLPTEYRILGISGQSSAETKVPLLQQLADVNIVVLTPQIFLNAKNADIRHLFTIFSMLIFDECHHTNKEHPYNGIMSFYLDIKHEGGLTGINLPKIIGLTASVGVGKAKDEAGVEKHIISLAANMDAQKIQTVVREVDSLLQYANNPAQGICEVPGRTVDPFSQLINSLMQQIETRMKLTADSDCPEMKKNLAAPGARSHQRYINWQDGVRKEAVKIFNQEIRRTFISCLKYLEIFHNVLVLNLDCRTQDACDFMEKELSHFKPEYHDSNEKWLATLYQEYKEQLLNLNVHLPNPKLQKLAEILRRSTTRSDCRTIIFVRTRAMTVALTNWMNSDPTLASLKPNYLTGAGANAGSGGLTQIQQEDLLKAFKQGDHKVVIATSVAEEGLDVQKCNLVIRYEYVTNEIAMMQARGRGRADNAEYILITDREANRERINQLRESMMQDSLQQLTQSETFATRVGDIQKKARVERKLKAYEKKRKAQRSQQKTNIQFCFYCLKCDAYACTSTDIRKAENAHHLVISRDFEERLRFVPEPKPMQFGGGEVPFTRTGKIYCAKCNYDWGVKMLYHSCQMPVIKVASFLLEDRNQQRQKFKKWKDVPFQVPDMSGDDWERFLDQVESDNEDVENFLN